YEKIKEISAQKGVLDIVVEKDYILDWVLWGISQNDYLKNVLAFKGGTALHKMYFPDWRFSEDLDFTTVGQVGKDELSDTIEKLCRTVKSQSGIDLRQREITASGDKDSEWSFEAKIEYIGPRGQTGNPLPTILLHITNDELIKDKPVKKVLIAPYDDLPFNFSLMTYSLEEILSEKIRTVFHQRCWPRDIYDTWRLLKITKDIIDIEKVLNIYNRKSEYRGFNVGIPSNIDERILRIKNQWREGLQRQISNPPDFDSIYPEVIELLKKLFEDNNTIKKGGITMLESHYSIRYKRGDLEIEVQGDKAFVEGKFKELLDMKPEIVQKETYVPPPEQSLSEGGKKISLAEFLGTKNPKSHGDKILTFGYFLEKNRGYSAFNLNDIEACYKEARLPKTKNFSTYITQLIRDGYLVDAEEKKDNKKAWELTAGGLKYVEELASEGE
ncbi:MAG: nucleotidyl transferase AbiEii/AbiGii toxin family protein, partial [Candidatus Subteraquimicrobiales bacterium]|nr:nucleotidyl transferase AbiEii/AbiGii toxin family protein [Candidatus Subteraquimicrobiales bacterium]